MKLGLGIGGLQIAGGARLELAAVTAATAASGRLFYPLADFSNVFTDSGTTRATAVGQAIGQINDVLGSGGYFRQTTAANRPLLSAAAGGYALTFDGSTDFMTQDALYFASGDDTFTIAAFLSSASASTRVIHQQGNNGSNVRYPYMSLNNTDDTAICAWRGDDTTNRNCTGTTGLDAVPAVQTAWKSGANKILYVNGVQEGATNTGAVGSIASLTRSYLGAATNDSAYFPGPIALLFESKTLTSAQRIDIERFAAFLIGATYLG